MTKNAASNYSNGKEQSNLTRRNQPAVTAFTQFLVFLLAPLLDAHQAVCIHNTVATNLCQVKFVNLQLMWQTVDSGILNCFL